MVKYNNKFWTNTENTIIKYMNNYTKIIHNYIINKNTYTYTIWVTDLLDDIVLISLMHCA